MREKRRVVVTGMGVVTPVGLNIETFWKNMLDGRPGIRKITAFDVSECRSQNAAEVDEQQLAAALAARGMRQTDRVVDMALLAATEAMDTAGLLPPAGVQPSPQNTATIIGSGGGPIAMTEDLYHRYYESGPKGVRPTTIVRIMSNVISSQVSMRFRLTGPNYIVVSACGSSTNAIGLAFRMIRDGYISRAVCGGVESCFSPGLYVAWDKLRVMSSNPDPARAGRPFDAARDGFVMGEGGAMFVIEERSTALERGARIRGEIIGYGESSDAEHITRPSEAGQTRAMRQAIEDAGISPSDIGFINAHGTATEANDECESRSIRGVLGAHTDNVPVASNKSFFGHMLGASGAAEIAVTLLGLEAGEVPPNLNLDNPDPACNLKFVGSTAMKIPARIAMKNSFGFGGNNAVLVVGRSDL